MDSRNGPMHRSLPHATRRRNSCRSGLFVGCCSNTKLLGLPLPRELFSSDSEVTRSVSAGSAGEKACELRLPPQQALPVPPAAFAGRSGRRWYFRSLISFCSKKHREEVGADISYPRAFHEKVNKFWGRHLPGVCYPRAFFER